MDKKTLWNSPQKLFRKDVTKYCQRSTCKEKCSAEKGRNIHRPLFISAVSIFLQYILNLFLFIKCHRERETVGQQDWHTSTNVLREECHLCHYVWPHLSDSIWQFRLLFFPSAFWTRSICSLNSPGFTANPIWSSPGVWFEAIWWIGHRSRSWGIFDAQLEKSFRCCFFQREATFHAPRFFSASYSRNGDNQVVHFNTTLLY